MATINDMLDYGKKVLEESGNEYAKYERKALLEYVLDVNYMYMLLNGDEDISEDKVLEYKRLICKRIEHYPLQYLLGYTHFMDYSFYVDENVLIPRSDTEILVESVNELFDNNNDILKDKYKVLDLCCGSGCIGISLKLYHPQIELTLSDVSDKALNVSKRNLIKYQLSANINLGDLWEGINEKYDLIVCNPPYIKSDIIETLMPEVRDYEPRIALDGGRDGVAFYKRIADKAAKYLNENGYVFFEIGYDQGEEVSNMIKNTGFKDVLVKKDYGGFDRVISGHL